jgi:alanyl-tRNA synthetase
MLDQIMADLGAAGETVIPGLEAFRLYDTFGFPLDLTRDVGAEHGFLVDEDGFAAALEEQRARGRAAQQFVAVDGEERGLYARLADEFKAHGGLGPDGVEELSPMVDRDHGAGHSETGSP